jgi:hypothetical protein
MYCQEIKVSPWIKEVLPKGRALVGKIKSFCQKVKV